MIKWADHLLFYVFNLADMQEDGPTAIQRYIHQNNNLF